MGTVDTSERKVNKRLKTESELKVCLKKQLDPHPESPAPTPSREDRAAAGNGPREGGSAGPAGWLT